MESLRSYESNSDEDQSRDRDVLPTQADPARAAGDTMTAAEGKGSYTAGRTGNGTPPPGPHSSHGSPELSSSTPPSRQKEHKSRKQSPVGRKRSRSPIAGHSRQTQSPDHNRRPRSSAHRKRSRSPSYHKRSHSPGRKKHSPVRKRSHSPDPTHHKQSPSPSRCKRSPSSCDQSHSPAHRERSHSPVYDKRSHSPVHRKGSRSSAHRKGSRSSVHSRRSRSPAYRDRSRSPVHRKGSRSFRSKGSRSPPYRGQSRSPPYHERSHSPVHRKSRPVTYRRSSASANQERSHSPPYTRGVKSPIGYVKSQSPGQHRSQSPTMLRDTMSPHRRESSDSRIPCGSGGSEARLPQAKLQTSSASIGKKGPLAGGEKLGAESGLTQGKALTPEEKLEQALAAAQALAPKLPACMNPGAVNPIKYHSVLEKRKLLWSKKKDGQSRNKWEMAAFSGGDTQAKFRRLMGISGEKVGEEVQKEESEQLREKHAKTLSTLEEQFDNSRYVTHIAKGAGLGYGSESLLTDKRF